MTLPQVKNSCTLVDSLTVVGYSGFIIKYNMYGTCHNPLLCKRLTLGRYTNIYQNYFMIIKINCSRYCRNNGSAELIFNLTLVKVTAYPAF